MSSLDPSFDNKLLLSGNEHISFEDGSCDHNNYLHINVQQCPTCLGKGKLTQSQADSVLALISVSDRRLRPKRTKIYLGITLLLCLVCIVLIAFFFFPRSVTLFIIATNSVDIYMPMDLTNIPRIKVEVTYQLDNQNYFQVHIKNFYLDIYWNKYILNTSTDVVDMVIPPRFTKKIVIPSEQLFTGAEVNKNVQNLCASGWRWNLLEKFVVTADADYLSQTQQLSYTYFGYVACHNTSSSLAKLT
nr:transmembrane protein 106B [Hydra vulgaris]